MAPGILWLEGNITDGPQDHYTTRPLSEMFAATLGVPVLFHTTLTTEELVCQLERFPRKDFPIVYFSCHGRPGKLLLHKLISLNKLSPLLGDLLQNRAIHFSSCLVMKDEEAIVSFKEETGLAVMSGYRKAVLRLESSVLDSLILQAFCDVDILDLKAPKKVLGRLQRSASDLLKSTQFNII